MTWSSLHGSVELTGYLRQKGINDLSTSEASSPGAGNAWLSHLFCWSGHIGRIEHLARQHILHEIIGHSLGLQVLYTAVQRFGTCLIQCESTALIRHSPADLYYSEVCASKGPQSCSRSPRCPCTGHRSHVMTAAWPGHGSHAAAGYSLRVQRYTTRHRLELQQLLWPRAWH